MDAEAIATEIVRIRTRLDEIDDDQSEVGTEIADEKKRLEERLRDLRGLMSRQGSDEKGGKSVAEEVRYIPPG